MAGNKYGQALSLRTFATYVPWGVGGWTPEGQQRALQICRIGIPWCPQSLASPPGFSNRRSALTVLLLRRPLGDKRVVLYCASLQLLFAYSGMWFRSMLVCFEMNVKQKQQTVMPQMPQCNQEFPSSYQYYPISNSSVWIKNCHPSQMITPNVARTGKRPKVMAS